jgi:hypothetical protein
MQAIDFPFNLSASLYLCIVPTGKEEGVEIDILI